MADTKVFTVFYSVPGQYCASTEVWATSKEDAAAKVVKRLGVITVTGVMNGR